MPSPLIPASTRAAMRATRTRTLVDTCAVQVQTQSDTPGGVADSWSTAMTVPCRVESPTVADSERFRAGQLRAEPTAVVAFAPGTTIASTSRLVVTGSVETGVGTASWTRTLEVLGDSGPTSVTVERRYPCRDVGVT